MVRSRPLGHSVEGIGFFLLLHLLNVGRKGDSTSIILPGDAVSVRCCHLRLCEDLLCCRVQQKLPRDGAFVSYPLAGGELERVAGAKYLRFFERLPVLITPTAF